jgi:hypothetical protein
MRASCAEVAALTSDGRFAQQWKGRSATAASEDIQTAFFLAFVLGQ